MRIELRLKLSPIRASSIRVEQAQFTPKGLCMKATKPCTAEQRMKPQDGKRRAIIAENRDSSKVRLLLAFWLATSPSTRDTKG